MSVERTRVLGIPVDAVTLKQAVQRVQLLLAEQGPNTVIAINPEKIVRAQRDLELRTCIERASLLIPDGIGVVLASRLLPGPSLLERVPGVELMMELCRAAEAAGEKVFVLGGRPDVNAGAVARLRAEFPGLQIAGHRHGYFTGEEEQDVVDMINASGARLLLVALGSPRQERWMARTLPRLTTVRVAQGIGGSLDVLVGTVKRAPEVWRRFHGEWLYRVLAEPRRLNRYTSVPVFIWRVIHKAVQLRLKR